MNRKEQISIVLFMLALFALLVLKNNIAGIPLLIMSSILNRRMIVVHLLTLPLIETGVVIQSGLTISKILYSSYILFFLITFFKKDNNDKRPGYRMLFILLLLFVISGFNELSLIQAGNASVTELIKSAAFKSSRFILLFFLYQYLVKRGKLEIQRCLNLLFHVLLVFVPILFYFIQSNTEVLNWRNTVMRYTLENTDANELGGLLACLTPILFLSKAKTHLNLLRYIALALVVFLVLKTGSRGAFISLVSVVAAVGYIQLKQNGLGAAKLLFLGLIISSVFFTEASSVALTRFTSSQSDNLNSVTGGRSDLWQSTLQGCLERPFLGHGCLVSTIENYNYAKVGKAKVAHNTPIQILFEFGILGALLLNSLRLRYLTISKQHLYADIYYASIVLSIFTFSISSMGLSWFWREILWVFLAILCAYNDTLMLHENPPANSSSPKLGC